MLRDGTTGDWIGTFVGHKGAVWSCRMDPTGNLAATASGDFSVQIFDAITGQSLHTLPHAHIVKTCDFSPNSKYLATGGHEGLLRVYDLTKLGNEEQEALILSIPQDTEKLAINKCNWLSNDIIITGCADGMVRFWSTKDPKQPIRQFKVEGEIRDMEITKTTTKANILTVAAADKVSFFSLDNNSLIKSVTMPIHFRDEGGASLHPSGTKFVAGGSDLWVRVFDFATGKELECLKGHHGPIRCIRYSPDGDIYASGSEDGTIRLWKTNPEE